LDKCFLKEQNGDALIAVVLGNKLGKTSLPFEFDSIEKTGLTWFHQRSIAFGNSIFESGSSSRTGLFCRYGLSNRTDSQCESESSGLCPDDVVTLRPSSDITGSFREFNLSDKTGSFCESGLSDKMVSLCEHDLQNETIIEEREKYISSNISPINQQDRFWEAIKESKKSNDIISNSNFVISEIISEFPGFIEAMESFIPKTNYDGRFATTSSEQSEDHPRKARTSSGQSLDDNHKVTTSSSLCEDETSWGQSPDDGRFATTSSEQNLDDPSGKTTMSELRSDRNVSSELVSPQKSDMECSKKAIDKEK
jgi:hypothetical protein